MGEVSKDMYYALLIQNQILEMFNDEECSNHIELEELNENDNAARFMHALTCASALIYNRLTGEERNFLEFNHIANRLCFQYANKEK